MIQSVETINLAVSYMSRISKVTSKTVINDITVTILFEHKRY